MKLYDYYSHVDDTSVDRQKLPPLHFAPYSLSLPPLSKRASWSEPHLLLELGTRVQILMVSREPIAIPSFMRRYIMYAVHALRYILHCFNHALPLVASKLQHLGIKALNSHMHNTA